jgi:tetratricopeptide (TPR) repeat protein
VNRRLAALGLVLFFLSVLELPAAQACPQAAVLFNEQHWAELEKCLTGLPQPSSDQLYYRGMALAALGRREAAKEVLESGARQAPRDKRFPTELAGIAFLEKRYEAARRSLRRARRLDPGDRYVTDLLASVYLLEGNLEGALHYWNEIDKPLIEQVVLDPQPGTDAMLLDRSLAFAPGEPLRLAELELSRRRLRHLALFPRFRFSLAAREDRRFDVRLAVTEPTRWRDSNRSAALSLLRGLPYHTIHPEFYDLDGAGLSIESLLRWDPKKSRIHIVAWQPMGGDPAKRIDFFADGRDEDWRLPAAASPQLPPDFRMRRARVGAGLSLLANEHWSWHTSLALGTRSFDALPVEEAGLPNRGTQRFLSGPSIEYGLGADYRVTPWPYRSFTVDAAVDWQLGRMLGRQSRLYSKVSESIALNWLPLAASDDYRVKTVLRAGQTAGEAPFDELYALGMERDNELWLRGRRGTRHGFKGAALLGDRFMLSNSELDKYVYRRPFVKLAVGPFLDFGVIRDSRGFFPAQGWQWNTGVQCKLEIGADLSAVLHYGRDLRAGGGAFYWQILRNREARP